MLDKIQKIKPYDWEVFSTPIIGTAGVGVMIAWYQTLIGILTGTMTCAYVAIMLWRLIKNKKG